jgi:hypothetical protein
MHSPAAQRWPPAQAGPVPHSQAPVAPQRLALLVSQAVQALPPVPQVARAGVSHAPPLQHPAGHEVASQTQAPLLHRWPAAQGGPPPQRHAPSAEQVSALPSSQPTQAPPAVPQVETDRG